MIVWWGMEASTTLSQISFEFFIPSLSVPPNLYKPPCFFCNTGYIHTYILHIYITFITIAFKLSKPSANIWEKTAEFHLIFEVMRLSLALFRLFVATEIESFASWSTTPADLSQIQFSPKKWHASPENHPIETENHLNNFIMSLGSLNSGGVHVLKQSATEMVSHQAESEWLDFFFQSLRLWWLFGQIVQPWNELHPPFYRQRKSGWRRVDRSSLSKSLGQNGHQLFVGVGFRVLPFFK